MKLLFTKMQGLGNDFMVINGLTQKINLSPEQVAHLANRHTGIGFDQCLLVEASNQEGIDFNYRIFNANGQEVGQCGNGARCLGRFVRHYGLTSKKNIRIATQTTQMLLQVHEDDTVSVDMGLPKLEPDQIPFLAEKQQKEYLLKLDQGQEIVLHALSVGNPHAVLLVEESDKAPLSILGPQITHHPRFPQQTNTGFMQIINAHHIKLRVYERGCGETLACGSGAVAAAAIARLYYQAAPEIKVSLTGGDLIVHWPDLNGSIYLRGPAVFVYEGSVDLY